MTFPAHGVPHAEVSPENHAIGPTHGTGWVGGGGSGPQAALTYHGNRISTLTLSKKKRGNIIITFLYFY